MSMQLSQAGPLTFPSKTTGQSALEYSNWEVGKRNGSHDKQGLACPGHFGSLLGAGDFEVSRHNPAFLWVLMRIVTTIIDILASRACTDCSSYCSDRACRDNSAASPRDSKKHVLGKERPSFGNHTERVDLQVATLRVGRYMKVEINSSTQPDSRKTPISDLS
jgi:hypothetical protein